MRRRQQQQQRQRHSSYPRARSVRERSSVRAADSADQRCFAGAIILSLPFPGQARIRLGGQPLCSLCCAPPPLPIPTGRPATASLRTPLALGRSASVSAKTSREGVFLDSPPACRRVPERVVVDSSTRTAAQHAADIRASAAVFPHTASYLTLPYRRQVSGSEA